MIFTSTITVINNFFIEIVFVQSKSYRMLLALHSVRDPVLSLSHTFVKHK